MKSFEMDQQELVTKALETFPQFFSDKRFRSLLVSGHFSKEDRGNLYADEYAHAVIMEVGNLHVFVMDFAERFYDRNGDSGNKRLVVVLKRRASEKEKVISKEYWKYYNLRRHKTDNIPEDVSYGAHIEVKDLGDGKLEINSLKDTYRDGWKTQATFILDLTFAEIEKVK